MGGPIGGLLKGAGFVIGLGTELHAHNKAKKSSSQSLQQQGPQRGAVQDGSHTASNGGPPTYKEAIAFSNSADSKSPGIDEKPKPTGAAEQIAMSPLPYPVILPQRRPNDKSRGFVRAYAPDLGRCKGIDEATFLSFLKQFHKSSQASGWFQVVNLAAMGAGFAPSAIAMAVTMSVSMASRAAAEAQSRHRTNSYLDKANGEFFHPRNLHCMMMTFRPEASENAVLNLDVDSGSEPSGGMAMANGTFRAFNGMRESDLALPQAAYLVYPTPKPAEASLEVDEVGLPRAQKESAWRSTGKFVSDYKDRRAQAKFAATYGDDSTLAVPGALDPGKFASRFSDPNANPFSFMSGSGQQRNTARDQLQAPGSGARDRSRSSGRGGIRNMMQQDILYLLIAEIPSEEDMRRML